MEKPLEQPAQLAHWRSDSSVYELPIASTTVMTKEHSWMSLLDLMQHCGTWRFMYCFVFKRWIDISVAVVMLFALSPLFLLVALALRLEGSGSVIFRQTRIGKNGRPFIIYKFRTMIPERRKKNIGYESVDRRVRHKTPTDPRIIRLGKILRRTSIDELPQLFNILRNEMSLVGPRPELPEIVARYELWQHQRHLVKPGLTGWWQTQGQTNLPMHEHSELDLHYVVNMSFLFDLQIIVRTVRIILRRPNAY